jgi:hypothetical protein
VGPSTPSIAATLRVRGEWVDEDVEIGRTPFMDPPSRGKEALLTFMRPSMFERQTTELALDDAGNATAVWYEYVSPNTNDWYLQTRQISATGALAPTQTLAIAPIRQPQSTVNGEGDALAVWSQFDGSNWSAWGAQEP